MGRLCTAIVMSCWLVVSISRAAADEIDFVRDVQPVLAKHCLACHGDEERNGGLSFIDPATLFAVADSGSRPIVVHRPEASEVITRVRSTVEDEQMPPEGERLSTAEIRLLTDWIAAGAPWDPSQPDHGRRPPQSGSVTSDHWSFQPLGDPIPPSVEDSHWPRNPIDRFVQARRDGAGLKVTSDADPAVLIRRASYGLTGLPPTPAEVDEFIKLADSNAGIEGAMVTLVDRLLGQPAYGERWGRHWMDWVRYADTAGDNSDFPIPQAYLYRNYLIESLNADVPYDRFLTEQLAGDLLPAESQDQRNRQAIATGYLAMARRFGSLVERYPWHLTIEDTIDNVGRTMLGLSLACARCHDHKFDPVTTRDYYGLYGIFASTRYPMPGLELFQAQRDLVPLIPHEEATQAMKPHQAKIDELTAELERRLAACEQQSILNAEQEGHVSLDESRKLQAELDAMLIKARQAGERLADFLKTIAQVSSAYAVQDATPQDARIQIKGEFNRLGAEVPRKFPEILGGQRLTAEAAQSQSGRLELADWIANPNNPLTARVIVNRVWQRHFGRGLVSSTSDFGVRGEPPTHPELLDWLAAEFIRSDWSLKHLHRLIMTSRVYGLSSADVTENLQADPDNRLYWKFNRQRLDAESIRDTLLLVSGSLDTTPQVRPYPIPPQKDWEYTQHHPFKDDYASDKRSVYLMTKRLTANPYFQTFDGPDPNVCTSDRDESVTALQALYFVNDKFLHRQADGFAKRVLQQPGTDQQKIASAFSVVLCRQPSPTESLLLEEHLTAVRQQLAGEPDPEQQAWSSLSRSLMRLNEFLYID